MARTALNGPAHRIMGRMPLGTGPAGQPLSAAPSLDMGGSGIQDSRLLWNTGNSASGAQIVGWYDLTAPVLDFTPATLTTTAIAAAQVPVAGTPITLVSATGAGVTVSSSPTLMLPSLVTIPAGALFLDSIVAYDKFGTGGDITAFYQPSTMGARNIQIASVGNDSAGFMSILGWDPYGFVMHETITLANAGTATGKKAFKAIFSATPSGTLSGSNVSIGQGDTYGIPIFTSDTNSGIEGFWNNANITGTGTITAGITATATATTGDVRGTYLVGSASNAAKRLTIYAHPVLSRMVAAGINQGLFGVPQF